MIRLGNNEVMARAIETMRSLYKRCKNMQVFETALDRNKKTRTERARELYKLLQKQEEFLDLQERLETVDRLLQDPHNLTFTTQLTEQRNLIKAQLRQAGTATTENALALTDRTRPSTYNWLKNNKELINVAVSRARERLVIYSSMRELKRLHGAAQDDDLYELVEYVRTNGTSEVTPRQTNSRALGIKPYSTRTEEAFLQNLNHALDTILMDGSCVVHKEVPIAQVFENNPSYNDLFYTGRFDFVVYQKIGGQEQPVLAIELDGKEHLADEVVRQRDEKKNAICKEHGFVLIRVPNSYARRYHNIKSILEKYFKSA